PKFFIARDAAPTLPASCGSTRITRIFTEASLDAPALAAREETVIRLGELRRVFFECVGGDEVDPSRRRNADASLNDARPLRRNELFFLREAMKRRRGDDDRMIEIHRLRGIAQAVDGPVVVDLVAGADVIAQRLQLDRV